MVHNLWFKSSESIAPSALSLLQKDDQWDALVDGNVSPASRVAFEEGEILCRRLVFDLPVVSLPELLDLLIVADNEVGLRRDGIYRAAHGLDEGLDHAAVLDPGLTCRIVEQRQQDSN